MALEYPARVRMSARGPVKTCFNAAPGAAKEAPFYRGIFLFRHPLEKVRGAPIFACVAAPTAYPFR